MHANKIVFFHLLTSPKKTMSGFITGTLVNGDDADPVAGGEPRCCDADGGEGKGSEGSPGQLSGSCCIAEDTDDRPSSVTVEAFSMPAAAATAASAIAATTAAGSVLSMDGVVVVSFGFARSAMIL